MKTNDDKKSGPVVAQTVPRAESRRAKTHQDFWKDRLVRRSYADREGRLVEMPEWHVRIALQGRRDWFNLDTANQAAAAVKARDIYLSLVSAGWDATTGKFKPEAIPTKLAGRVGEAITAAQALSTTRPQSFAQAALRLRQLAGEIDRVKPPTNRTAYMSEEFKSWRAKIDAVPLTVFSGENVRAWRDRRIAARAGNPIEKRAATISADSTIRMARAIFSKRILAAGLGSKVDLPTPLPFAGVTVGGSTKRFSEKVDAVNLFAAARAALETAHPEQFRAFALCILAGLRRSEADRLTWQQVDLAGATLTIERTEYFEPKSEESTRQIALASAVVKILRHAKSDEPDPVFVLKGAEHRQQLKAATFYRCDAAPWRTWRNLSAWLGEHGIRDGKPIHVLRKLAGSLIFAEHGLEQARGFLGHSSVVTTSASYLSPHARQISVSIAEPTDEVSALRDQSAARRGDK